MKIICRECGGNVARVSDQVLTYRLPVTVGQLSCEDELTSRERQGTRPYRTPLVAGGATDAVCRRLHPIRLDHDHLAESAARGVTRIKVSPVVP